MIYKIYRPASDLDIYSNSFVSYLSLCKDNINKETVYKELLRAKIISSSWLDINELTLSHTAPNAAGNRSYTLKKNRPTKIFFKLIPIYYPPEKPESMFSDTIFSYLRGNPTATTVANRLLYFNAPAYAEIDRIDLNINIPAAADNLIIPDMEDPPVPQNNND
jgi:hypothetical protein